MTYKDTITWLTDSLTGPYQQESAHRLALQLAAWALGHNTTTIITHPQTDTPAEALKQLTGALEAHLTHHKPLQYCIGTVPFGDLELFVEPPTLIPRPETEEWVTALCTTLSKAPRPPRTILDMCTGSGCIALSLAHALPNSTIYAVDCSPQALALTTKNLKQLKLTNVIPLRSNLFADIPRDLRFDCIVSNPPYVSEQDWPTLEPQVRSWEDKQALVAEDDGYALIKELIVQAPAWLADQDRTLPALVIEIGATQGSTAASLMQEGGFAATIDKDLQGNDRVVQGRQR